MPSFHPRVDVGTLCKLVGGIETKVVTWASFCIFDKKYLTQ